jgi:hypothetical protein
MIIVKLLVANKEQGDTIAGSLLKNKFTLNVFGNLFDSFHLNSSQSTENTNVYVIQFLTKSMLFNEIETGLKNEFPQFNFSICATPIVHMAIHLHDKIKERVNGTNAMDDETDS